MLTRYISWLAIGLAAAFLVVASSAFGSLAAIAWLAFAISVGTLLVSTGLAYGYRRHIPTLITAIVTAVVSAWTIVASLVFSQPTVQNLALAGALALGGLALVGLTVHELSSERITHSLEVTDNQHDHHLAAAV
jgi:drug/metabolite transporter (DMT)-like permease